VTALEIKLAIGAAILAVSLAAFAWYHHRVILEGEAKIEASDAKATAALKAKTDAETAKNEALASQAKQAADHEQQALDNYARAHPIGDVRVCHTSNNSGPKLPQAGPANGGAQSSSPGSAPVPAMPASPDIGPALGELMLDAARLATLNAEWQHR